MLYSLYLDPDTLRGIQDLFMQHDMLVRRSYTGDTSSMPCAVEGASVKAVRPRKVAL